MGAALHLVKGGDPALIRAVIEGQLAASDRVTVVVLPGADAPALPAGVTARRVPDQVSYGELVDLIFAADHVVTW